MTELNKDPLYERLIENLCTYSSKAGTGKLHKLADAIGVQSNTAHSWVSGKNVPFGESAVRLVYFLEELGYESPIKDSVTDIVRLLGRLLAFRVLTLEEIIASSGSEKTKDPRTAVLAVLLGKRGVSTEREARLALLAREFEVLLPDEIRRFVNDFGPAMDVTKVVPPTASEPERPSPSREVSRSAVNEPLIEVRPLEHAAVIESLALQIRALLPLAKIAASDAFSAEDRIRIRELAGGDGVFKASNLLTRLCSEKARTLV